MAVVYSTAAITARLNSMVTAIGAGSFLLYAGGTLVATIALTSPYGTVDSTTLTFATTPITATAVATGTVTGAVLVNSDGTIGISSLTVGIPTSGSQIELGNGLNTLYVTSGQTVSLLGAQIVGS